MVMSTKTAAALLGRRRPASGAMIKVFILQAFELGDGRGTAIPGTVIDVSPERALHLMGRRRARMATADDMPKRRRRSSSDAEPTTD